MTQFEVLTGENAVPEDGAVVKFCDNLPDGGKIPIGQAVWIEEKGENPPYSMYAAFPDWAGGTQNETAALASCCRSCLNLAKIHGVSAVNFPSAGSGYPVSQAASVLEKTVMDFLREGNSMRVRIVCGSEQEAAVYRMTYNLLYAETKAERL